MNYSVNSKKLMHLRSIILPRRCIFKEVAAALLLMMMMFFSICSPFFRGGIREKLKLI